MPSTHTPCAFPHKTKVGKQTTTASLPSKKGLKEESEQPMLRPNCSFMLSRPTLSAVPRQQLAFAWKGAGEAAQAVAEGGGGSAEQRLQHWRACSHTPEGGRLPATWELFALSHCQQPNLCSCREDRAKAGPPWRRDWAGAGLRTPGDRAASPGQEQPKTSPASRARHPCGMMAALASSPRGLTCRRAGSEVPALQLLCRPGQQGALRALRLLQPAAPLPARS